MRNQMAMSSKPGLKPGPTRADTRAMEHQPNELTNPAVAVAAAMARAVLAAELYRSTGELPHWARKVGATTLAEAAMLREQSKTPQCP